MDVRVKLNDSKDNSERSSKMNGPELKKYQMLERTTEGSKENWRVFWNETVLKTERRRYKRIKVDGLEDRRIIYLIVVIL